MTHRSGRSLFLGDLSEIAKARGLGKYCGDRCGGCDSDFPRVCRAGDQSEYEGASKRVSQKHTGDDELGPEHLGY